MTWEAIRQAMHLDPAVTNLNTGSFGPLPRMVFARVTELRQRLAEEPMDFFLRFMPPLLHGFMTAFRLPGGTDAIPRRKRLWEEHRIEVPIVERPHGLLLRVSTHFYNTEEQVERLAASLCCLSSPTRSDTPVSSATTATRGRQRRSRVSKLEPHAENPGY